MRVECGSLALVLGVAFALAGPLAAPVYAQTPGPEARAALTTRLAHSRVRFLTLSGYFEAGGVQVTDAGFASPDLPATRDSLSPVGVLPWNAVLAVDVQGNQAARGALGGGLALGVVGLLIGFAGGVASPEGEVGLWSFEGLAAGFGSGAVLGGLVGAAKSRWVRVYPTRSGSGTGNDAPRPRVATARDTATVTPVRVLAIAPFANVSKHRHGAQAAQRIREGIMRELMRHPETNTVTIQAIEETDRRLREASYSADAASRMPAGDLCRLLGAEAVMMGAITRYRQKSGVGTFTSVLFIQPGARAREVEADIAIFAGAGGETVWRHHVRTATPLFTSTAMLGDAVGEAVAQDFPYALRPTRH